MIKEQVIAIIALNAQGKTPAEIASERGLTEDEVRKVIEEQGREPNEPGKEPAGYRRISDKIKDKIIEEKKKGRSDADIAKELGIGKSSVYRTWSLYKLIGKQWEEQEDIEEIVEEEFGKGAAEEIRPEPPKAPKAEKKAEQKASREDDYCSTDSKSQKLSGIAAANTIEGALNEWLGSEAEIIMINASRTKGEVRFTYQGEAYGFRFGRLKNNEKDTDII